MELCPADILMASFARKGENGFGSLLSMIRELVIQNTSGGLIYDI